MREETGQVIQRLLAARGRHQAGLEERFDGTDWLEKGDIEGCDLLPWGSNYTFIVAISGGTDERFAIYKPRRGEMPLWDFPQGTLYQRECAAYVLAQSLGWEMVPPTIIRCGPLGIGSFQRYIDCDAAANYFTLGPGHEAETQRIALFDCLVNNADRKAGHCLLGAGGQLWAIDHGLTFHADPKLRTVIWDYAGQPIPDALLADLAAYVPNMAPKEPLGERLAQLLSTAEMAALRSRFDNILRHPIFPHPVSMRSLPWPPV